MLVEGHHSRVQERRRELVKHHTVVQVVAQAVVAGSRTVSFLLVEDRSRTCLWV